MTLRASKPAFNVREKLTELGRRFGLKGSELAAAETVQEARDLVSAGRKNLIYNGKMEIAQRSTSETNIGSAFTYYTLDRWGWRNNGHGGRFTMSQDSDTPPGFYKSLKLEVTTADNSLTSNHYQGLSQRFETFDVHQLGYGTLEAKPVTLSFWVKSSLPGTYSCHFSFWNSSPGRNISKPYTINQPNTWEKKVITFEGDTSVAPSTDNTVLAAELGWCFTTTSFYNDGTDGGVWHDTSDAGKRHSGHVVNLSANTGTTWYMTGVQLEVGRNATEFEHRSHGEELALCQRYYGKIRLANQELIYNESGTSNHKWHQVYIPFSMRANPTIDVSDLTMGISVSGLSGTVSSYTAQRPGDTPGRISSRVGMTVNSGTARQIYHADGWNGDYIAVNAEL